MYSSVVLIEQTNYCNLHCEGCPNRLNQRKKGYMKPDMFESIIKQLDDKHTRVALHGFGEPFLSPHLFDNLGLLERYGFDNVDFSTNGALLHTVMGKLKKIKCLSWVRVSLNSSKKETMERTNTGANFKQVVENIKRLISSKPNFKIVIQHLMNSLTKKETKQDFKELLGPGFEYTEKIMHNYCGQVSSDLVEGRLLSCEVDGEPMFANSPIVHWDGDLVGCCADDTKTQVLGNIKDGLRTEKGSRLRKEFDRMDFTNLPLCRKCYEDIITN